MKHKGKWKCQECCDIGKVLSIVNGLLKEVICWRCNNKKKS